MYVRSNGCECSGEPQSKEEFKDREAGGEAAILNGIVSRKAAMLCDI